MVSVVKQYTHSFLRSVYGLGNQQIHLDSLLCLVSNLFVYQVSLGRGEDLLADRVGHTFL